MDKQELDKDKERIHKFYIGFYPLNVLQMRDEKIFT